MILTSIYINTDLDWGWNNEKKYSFEEDKIHADLKSAYGYVKDTLKHILDTLCVQRAVTIYKGEETGEHIDQRIKEVTKFVKTPLKLLGIYERRNKPMFRYSKECNWTINIKIKLVD